MILQKPDVAYEEKDTIFFTVFIFRSIKPNYCLYPLTKSSKYGMISCVRLILGRNTKPASDHTTDLGRDPTPPTSSAKKLWRVAGKKKADFWPYLPLDIRLE